MNVTVVPEQSVLTHNKRYGLRLDKRIRESAKMEVYYAGFNGFKQVQNSSKSGRRFFFGKYNGPSNIQLWQFQITGARFQWKRHPYMPHITLKGPKSD